MPSTLTYNATTGSDTAASGAGPATAITGTNATNGTGNVVNLDGSPDLSGVSVNDVIYIAVASGSRHLSRITAVDDGADTVTTEDTFTLTGQSWAIGGKRQTMINDTSRYDWQDMKHGWTFEFEDGSYSDNGAAITPGEVGDDTTGFITFKAAAGVSSKPHIYHPSGNNRLFSITAASPRVNLTGLQLDNDVNWIGANVIYTTSASGIYNIVDCEFTTAATTADPAAINISGASVVNIIGSYIHGNFGDGIIFASGNRGTGLIMGNWIDSVNGDGIRYEAPSSFTSRNVIGNVITSCGAYGIHFTAQADTAIDTVLQNTVYGCTSDGIYFDGTTTASCMQVKNNIITANGGYGINCVSAAVGGHVFTDYNAFYNNTSGEIQHADDGASNITLTGDPFTNAASDDFTLNDTASAGAACQAVGFPTAFESMTNYLDLGPLQVQDGGGGGGGSQGISQGLHTIDSGIVA